MKSKTFLNEHSKEWKLTQVIPGNEEIKLLRFSFETDGLNTSSIKPKGEIVETFH